jgi:hypothetical protein
VQRKIIRSLVPKALVVDRRTAHKGLRGPGEERRDAAVERRPDHFPLEVVNESAAELVCVVLREALLRVPAKRRRGRRAAAGRKYCGFNGIDCWRSSAPVVPIWKTSDRWHQWKSD